MAAVLEFRSASRPARRDGDKRRHAARPEGGDCEIVIFPGVRREPQTLDLAERDGGAGNRPGDGG